MVDNGKGREAKFKDLLARLAGSPLYRQKLSGYELAGVGLDRIQTLPFTTKEDLRKAGTFGHLAVEMKDVAHYHESTGTTGEPSASWFTREDLAAGGRQLKDCGVRLTADDLVLVRFPYALALPAFLMEQAAWQTGAGIVPASSRTAVTPYPKVLDLMKRLGVTVLAGLPREMELLAETARLRGMAAQQDFPSLRAICVAGELLGEKRREHIQRLWGVPVFNMYGSTETANIATMCEYGAMHIVEDDFFVEVLREDGSGPAASGEKGFAAITTLSHQGSPLLRYFNEDMISVEHSPCACGRMGGKLMHYGRSKDRIRLGGTVLDAWDIQEAVYSLSPVPDAWKVIERENGLHALLDSHDAGSWLADELAGVLSARLHVPVTVQIVTDASLLDRAVLANNAPSTKPVYIERRPGSASRLDASASLQYLLRLGQRKLADGEFAPARDLFQQAATADDRSAEAHAWLGAAYGRLIEAGSMPVKLRLLPLLEQHVSRALELDPSLAMARRVNGSRLLYTPESIGGDPAAAAAEFRYCIDRNMDDADVWVSLGECYMKLGKPEQALDAWKEALSREPGNRRARELLAEASEGNGDMEA